MNKAFVKVDPTKKRCDVSPSMYGIFYEEINHAGDGGLYAELISNRNFMNAKIPEGTWYYNGVVRTKARHTENFSVEDPLPSWTLNVKGSAIAKMEPWLNDARCEKAPNQLKLSVYNTNGIDDVELTNSGFWGISTEADDYTLTLIAKSEKITSLKAQIVSPMGDIIAETRVDGISSDWSKIKVRFTAKKAIKCCFRLIPESDGVIYFDYVSVFPVNTFMGRENGVKPHIAEMIMKLKPKFVRFPGGCIVEGISLENAWTFERTIGPVEDRPGCWNLWNYRRTDGLGYHEFMQFCEDIGADAMYVTNCGMSCQNRQGQLATGETLDFFLQDAINAIEYALSPVGTKWGDMRAAAGHPEPFPLKYVEIGNENHGADYAERYKYFYEELKARFPQLTYLANDSRELKVKGTEFVDEHFYMSPEFFASLYERYDSYDRDAFKVYVGEYACKTNVGIGNMISSISDAIFLMGCENNGDVVKMTSYAPLFCHQRDRRWSVNLICYEDDKVFGIPTFHLLSLLSEYKPENIVESSAEMGSFTGEGRIYANAGYLADGSLVLKLVNFSEQETAVDFCIPGFSKVDKAFLLAHESKTAENSPEYPENVCVKEISADLSAFVMKPYSFNLIKLSK